MNQPSPSFENMPEEARALDPWLLTDGRLDLLRERLTLSHLIGETIALEPAENGEFRAPCPAPDHDDEGKSFFVADRQGIFHCFGCGIHGDAIRWMMGHRGMGFVEAVRHLAHRGGLTASNATTLQEDQNGMQDTPAAEPPSDHRLVILDEDTFRAETAALRSVLTRMGVNTYDEACAYLTAVAHRRRNPGSMDWAIAQRHTIARWAPMPLISALSARDSRFGMTRAEAHEAADRTLHAIQPERTSLCRLRRIVERHPDLRARSLSDLADARSTLHPLLLHIRREGYETLGDLVDRGYHVDPARMRRILQLLIRLIEKKHAPSRIGAHRANID